MRQALAYTPKVAAATQSTYDRVRRVIPEVEWSVHAPYVALIEELKSERNAILLAHNYQSPEIFHGVADYKGDSLGLAEKAAHGGDRKNLESREACPNPGSPSGLLSGSLYLR